MKCDWCGEVMTGNAQQRFCSDDHRARFHYVKGGPQHFSGVPYEFEVRTSSRPPMRSMSPRLDQQETSKQRSAIDAMTPWQLNLEMRDSTHADYRPVKRRRWIDANLAVLE